MKFLLMLYFIPLSLYWIFILREKLILKRKIWRSEIELITFVFHVGSFIPFFNIFLTYSLIKEFK